MIKAVGNNAVIKQITTTILGGIQVKGDGEGIVQSCPSHPEIQGKRILFDDRHENMEYKDYIIIKTEHILAVLGDA